MDVILILIGWFMFATLFAELVPLLFEGLLNLLAYLIYAAWIAAKVILRLSYRIMVFASVRLWRLARAGALFAFLLAQEYWRGPPQDEQSEEESAEELDENEERSAEQERERARLALGLAPVFSRQELIAAFRAAIKKAHSDAGGTDKDARRIIAARDLLLREHGWA